MKKALTLRERMLLSILTIDISVSMLFHPALILEARRTRWAAQLAFIGWFDAKIVRQRADLHSLGEHLILCAQEVLEC